jgi:alpha-ketoglutarate-dependent taurine dioxygenase
MNSRREISRASCTAESLTVEWATGETADFASLWLRDNRADDRDPHSGQRLVDIADLPERPLIRSVAVLQRTVRVEWEDDSAASFELDWLAAQALDRALVAPERHVNIWPSDSALSPRRNFAWTKLDELRSNPHVRLDWLTRLLQSGASFLSGVPATENAILDAMSLAGLVCETNYGWVFDVRAVPQPENLAYSDLGLGLHTDNPYREPVPGFQALHTLLSSPDGGDSLFADGFALAEHLRRVDPGAFALLTRTAVPFSFRSKDAELYAERPLIQLSCDGTVTAVHYNNRSVAPLPHHGDDAAEFYVAYRRFAKLLREPRFQMTFKLDDGDLVLFDNQRILHGRTAFSASQHGRHLRGCYLTRDSVYSRTAQLRRDLRSTPEVLP